MYMINDIPVKRAVDAPIESASNDNTDTFAETTTSVAVMRTTAAAFNGSNVDATAAEY